MLESRKFHRPPQNIVYEIDGATYGLDDGLVEAITDSIRRRLQSKTLEIPRLPQVAGRILELSQNPETSLEQIAETLSTDPLLTTRMLSIANSAAYGGGARIEDVQQALLRLGSKLVMDTVFAESIRMKIFSARTYRPLLEESWKRSVGVAVACEALARATGIERDHAFLLGLLHDTGTPVLVNAVTEHEKQNGGRPLGVDVVEILVSQLHEETGAHVLTDWGMSPAIVDAAREHHRYRGAGKSPAGSSLAYAANLVCEHLGVGAEARNVDFTIEHVFADMHMAERDKVADLLEAVSARLQGLLGALPAG